MQEICWSNVLKCERVIPNLQVKVQAFARGVESSSIVIREKVEYISTVKVGGQMGWSEPMEVDNFYSQRDRNQDHQGDRNQDHQVEVRIREKVVEM